MSLPTAEEQRKRAEALTLRITGSHSPEWLLCASRWARDRWLIDDDALVAECVEHWDGADPTEAVDAAAERYAIDDPYIAWGVRHGQPLPIRAEYQL